MVINMADSEKFDLILSKIDKLDSRIDKLDSRMDKMDSRMDKMENDITDIKLTLENEIRVNIQRVAEGHLDLSRNLHEAMKPNNEVEMLSVKVRMLETDVKNLQVRLA